MAAIGIAWADSAWIEAAWETGSWASERVTPTVIRRGGRFLIEADPEIRKEKIQELKRLIKPRIRPKSTASATQEPQETLVQAIAGATSDMTPAQQTRTDRLLQQTGISLQELLIILKIS